MQSRKLPGFSMAEMLIALAIVVLLSLISIFELRTSNQGEELRSAAGQLAADIRSAQSRALEAQSVKTCPIGTEQAVCENADPGCAVGTCKDMTPSGYGVYASAGASTYIIFADVNPATLDYKYTNSKELFQSRDVLNGTTGKVSIESITTFRPLGGAPQAWASVSFVRQSGQTHIIDPLVGAQPEPFLIRILLRHAVSGKSLEVEVNQATGRVSII